MRGHFADGGVRGQCGDDPPQRSFPMGGRTGLVRPGGCVLGRERHRAILWAAMLGALAVLAFLIYRQVKTAPADGE